MKILWLCNIIPTQLSATFEKDIVPYGGWISGMLEELKKDKEYEICIAFPYKKEIYGFVDNLQYYAFKDCCFEKILNFFPPDIVHIYGTEYIHSYKMIDLCNKKGIINKVIINIQGLISQYKPYYYFADLPIEIIKSYTFRDLIKKNNIYNAAMSFKSRGKMEILSLQNVKYVSGRTEWDYVCSKQINNDICYYHCGEVLRPLFYSNSGKWDINMIDKYSIFVSQSNYPLKGFHKVIEAFPLVLKKFPNATISVTGVNPFDVPFYRQTSYQKFLKKIITELKIKDKIFFLGKLNEEAMCSQYLKSNVFVIASSIENSPNSLGESMMIGVPSIASNVGGVKDFIEHGETGFLYQFQSINMLANYICQVFADETLAKRMSVSASKKAMEIFDKKKNVITLKNIYKKIQEGK